MKPVKNPCVNCNPPQRNAHCHCAGQCAKGDAYQQYFEYRRWVNKQDFIKNTMPKKGIKVCPSKRSMNV